MPLAAAALLALIEQERIPCLRRNGTVCPLFPWAVRHQDGFASIGVVQIEESRYKTLSVRILKRTVSVRFEIPSRPAPFPGAFLLARARQKVGFTKLLGP
jgi:hypothetical protein